MLPTVSNGTPPLTLANPPTEAARRDNQVRERVTPAEAPLAGRQSKAATAERDPARVDEQELVGLPSDDEIAEGETEQAAKADDGGDSQTDEKSAASDQQQTDDATEAEREKIRELKARDLEVRTHEQAHAAAGGRYAGSPSYETQRGPDGQTYAVGGEVPIDLSPIPGDPQATIAKMQTVARAAAAPAEPSSQDRRVAAAAAAQESQARVQLMQEATATATDASASKQTDSSADGEAQAVTAESKPSADNAATPAATRSLESANDGRAIRIELHYLTRVVPAARPQINATA